MARKSRKPASIERVSESDENEKTRLPLDLTRQHSKEELQATEDAMIEKMRWEKLGIRGWGQLKPWRLKAEPIPVAKTAELREEISGRWQFYVDGIPLLGKSLWSSHKGSPKGWAKYATVAAIVRANGQSVNTSDIFPDDTTGSGRKASKALIDKYGNVFVRPAEGQIAFHDGIASRITPLLPQ